MKGKILNYYAEGNTARGFKNLYKSNLTGVSNLFILKGPPGVGKSGIIRKIGYEWLERGFDIEFLHSAFDNASLACVIIPSLKAAIIDTTEPRNIDISLLDGVKEYLDFEIAIDSTQIAPYKSRIANLNKNIKEVYRLAGETFLNTLVIHDEWEKIYIENIDFNKIEELRYFLQQKLFEDVVLTKNSNIKHRFFGAATPRGSVDFIEELTESMSKRYFIKGRPGTGKSTFLKKIAAEAQSKGLDIEVYHCGFDPNSIDMLIFRELGITIFDSTSPHEYFPTKESDEIIDVYAVAVTAGTDEKYENELCDIVKRYKSGIMQATLYLTEANHMNSELEQIYTNATDFETVEKIKQTINRSITKLK